MTRPGGAAGRPASSADLRQVVLVLRARWRMGFRGAARSPGRFALAALGVLFGIAFTAAMTFLAGAGMLHLVRHEGPEIADAALSGSFPAGFDFDGLALTIDAEHVAGSLGIIFAPRWSAGPFSADHVALTIAGVNAEPGLLVPELDVTLDA